MKVRVFHRIASAVIALALIAVTLLIVGVAWNIIDREVIEKYIDAFYTIDINAWLLTGVAFIVLLMAVALFFIAFGTDRKVNKYIDIGNEETGMIKIANTTFKEMINKNAMAVAGVRDSKTAINCDDSNVSVIIKIQVEEDVVIPTVCAEIQNQVKTNMEAMSGVTLHKVNVLVENEQV
jgi:hypothetical protein